MKLDPEDAPWVPTNRQKSLAPRKVKFYCGCDFAIVRPWAKCPVCKSRNGRRRLKK